MIWFVLMLIILGFFFWTFGLFAGTIILAFVLLVYFLSMCILDFWHIIELFKRSRP